MGCPGGTRSVFMYAFGQKENFNAMYTSREEGAHYYIQPRHNDLFFSHYNLSV